MIEILSCVSQIDICIILTRSSFKVKNNLNDLNLSNSINDLAVLSRQSLDKTTKKAFTINFQFDFILYNIEKFDETSLSICNQRSVNICVKLITKNKTFKRQIVELQNLDKTPKN